MAPKLPVISKATTHAKALTGGSVMAETQAPSLYSMGAARYPLAVM